MQFTGNERRIRRNKMWKEILYITAAVVGIIGFCIFLYDRQKQDKKLKRIMEMMKGQGVYIPELPKTSLIRKVKNIVATLIRKGFADAILAMGEYKYDEAIGIFRKLLPEAKGSHKVALLGLIGNCFYLQDNEALRNYKESLKLAEEIQDKEGIVGNLNNIGIVYVGKEDYDTAIRDYYDKAIEIDPNFAPAFNSRGNAYSLKRNYESAIQDFDKAIKLDPNHALAMSNMGLAYEGKGNKDKARQWYEKALEKKEYLPDGVEEKVRRWLKEL